MDTVGPYVSWYALLDRAQAAGWSLSQGSRWPDTTWWTMAPLADQRPATVQRLHRLEDVVMFLEQAELAPHVPPMPTPRITLSEQLSFLEAA